MRGNKCSVGCVGMGCFLGGLGVGIGGVSGVFCCGRESAQCLFYGVCFLIEVLLGFGFFCKNGGCGALSHCAVRGLYGDR